MKSCIPPQNLDGIGGRSVFPAGRRIRSQRVPQSNCVRHVVAPVVFLTCVVLFPALEARAQSLLRAGGLALGRVAIVVAGISRSAVAATGGAGTQREPNLPAGEEEVPSRDLEEEPSRIELLLSQQLPPDVCDVSLDLIQFGYATFRQPVTTFAPVNNVPVGPNYVIGPGDSFTLTLWGRVDAQYPLRVDRNGQVVLPEVGALKVWGMKFAELESYLQNELSRKYTDFKMVVTMDRLRSIRVFVVGEASAPGSYTISSLSTVINALFAAGGPSKNGSLRKIRVLRNGADPVLRNGADPVQIDLYDFLLGGDKSGDLRLQDGDTIFIPLIGPVAGVAGNVKRPAIYEMAGTMTLGEVLDGRGGQR